MNIVFKQHLKIFFRDAIGMRQAFVDEFDNIKTLIQLAEHFSNHGEELAKELGVDVDCECEDCADMEQRLREIEDKVIIWETMDEERKFAAYMEFHGKYNAQQMHDLLS